MQRLLTYTLLSVVALCALTHCKQDKTPTKPTQPTRRTPAPTVKETPKEATTPTKPTPSVTPPKQAQQTPKKRVHLKMDDPTTLKTFVGHLREGQKATRAKAYDRALSAYQNAITVDPNSPTAHGEMGWAYYKKGALEQAEEMTRRALMLSVNKKQQGIFLYNLGRILEDMGNPSRAMQYYEYSLKNRPNATVKKRVNALSKQGVQTDSTHECAFEPHPKDAPLKTICQAISMNKKDECTVHKPWQSIGKSRLALVSANDTDIEYHLAIIEHQGKQYVATLAMSSAGSEMREVWSMLDVSLEQVIPGGPPEIVIKSETEIDERGERLKDENIRGWDWTNRTERRLDIIRVDQKTPSFLLSMNTNKLKWTFRPKTNTIKIKASSGAELKSGTYKYDSLSQCPLPY